jgi:hypothetical protein
LNSSALPPDLQRWFFADCSFLTPAEWREADEQDDDTAYAIVPPTGGGRMVFSAIRDTQPPAAFGRDYAVEQISSGMRVVGLDPATYQIEQMEEDHYSALGESWVRGRFAIAAVHVYAPGSIVIAYYHSEAPDEHRPTAWAILNSVVPTDDLANPE